MTARHGGPRPRELQVPMGDLQAALLQHLERHPLLSATAVSKVLQREFPHGASSVRVMKALLELEEAGKVTAVRGRYSASDARPAVRWTIPARDSEEARDEPG